MGEIRVGRPPLVRVDRDGWLPASFTQEERLLHGRDIHVPNNTVVLALHLAGPLDTAALAGCVAEIVQRHECLRLIFPLDPAGCRLAVTDGSASELRLLSTSDSLDAALRQLAEAAAEPFDLAAGPLFRAVLVKVSDTKHVLGLILDHLVVDGQSCQVLLRDLLRSYDGAVRGVPVELPELTVQFPDFAAWEHAYLQGAPLERVMGFWRKTLDGCDPIPASGLVDPNPPVGLPPGQTLLKAAIGAELRDRIDKFARAEGVSLFAVFSAVLKAVAYTRRRAAGLDDAADVAVFGSLSNRGHRALREAVGYYATPTVFRTDLSGDPDLGELIKREAQALFGVLLHQDVPHALITRELNPAQYGIRHRFGRTEVPRYLNFDMAENWGNNLLQPQGLAVRTTRVPVREVPRGGLRLIVREKPDELVAEFRYRTDAYSQSWASAFLADYEKLLELVVDRPSTKLSALPS